MTQINWNYQVNNRAGGYIVTATDWNDLAGDLRALIDQTTSSTTDNTPLPLGIDLVNDRVYISDPDSTTPEDGNHADTTLSVVGTTTLAGATQQTGTFTVGVDDTGYDVKLFGATSGAYLLWDESEDDLVLAGAAGLDIAGDIDVDGTANLDAVDIDGAVQIDNTVTVGVDDTGYDVKFFGDTASAYMLWDTSTDDLVLAGAAGLDIAGDVDVDGTTNLDNVDIDGTVQIDNTVTVGVNDSGWDVKFFGATAGTYLLWDEDADELTFVAADLDMDDASVIRLGTGDDLLVYASGSHSFVDHSGDGDLWIRTLGSGEDLYVQSIDNLVLQTGGANDRLSIDSSGVVSIGGNIDLTDSSVIKFGTGDDLQIYSNGSHSFIDHDGDGELYIRARGTGEDLYLDAKDNLNLQTDSASHLTISSTGVLSVNPGGTYPVVVGVGNRSSPNGLNLAVGTGALAAVTADYNVAIGYNALNACTTSGWNTAVGHGSMALTTTQSGAPNYAQYNAALGYETLYNMIHGSGGNVALGHKAGRGMTTGMGTTFIGMQSGDGGVATGGNNTCVGYNTSRSLTTGVGTVSLGAYAGMNLTDGSNNHCLGYLAGLSMTSADDCVAIGTQALYLNVSADDNVAIGFQSLYNATNVTNTAVGSYAGHWTSTGYDNTYLGYYAGNAVSPFTGHNNTLIGNSAGPAAVGTNDSITLGNTAITSLRCYSALTDLSDERDKTDIQDFGMGLGFVRRLRPVRFEWNMRDGGKVGIPGAGFIAQELQQAQADEGKTIPNLILDENPDKLEAAITTLIPALVQAIQELDEKVEALT